MMPNIETAMAMDQDLWYNSALLEIPMGTDMDVLSIIWNFIFYIKTFTRSTNIHLKKNEIVL